MSLLVFADGVAGADMLIQDLSKARKVSSDLATIAPWAFDDVKALLPTGELGPAPASPSSGQKLVNDHAGMRPLDVPGACGGLAPLVRG